VFELDWWSRSVFKMTSGSRPRQAEAAGFRAFITQNLSVRLEVVITSRFRAT